jgi:hypothetical protein
MRDDPGPQLRFQPTRPPGPRPASPGQQGRACDSQAAFGPPFFPAGLAVGMLAFVLAACATLQAYPGPRLPPEERATVRGDPPLSAGLPAQAILRKAGDYAVSPGRLQAELPPGRHRLLVDCRVAASGHTARFAVEAELEAGRSYRLVADATARRCEAVRIEAR